MAIETLPYGGAEAGTPSEVRRERSTITQDGLGRKAQGVAEVLRVSFDNGTSRDVEIGKINHQALGRPVDKQYERNRASVLGRLSATGVATATVISFLPIPLRSDSCLDPLKPTKCKILPPKDGEPYSSWYFASAFIEPARQGVDSPLVAIDWHPIQLAMEFSKINPKGVMTFIGVPSDVEDPNWRKKRSTEEQHTGRTYGEVFESCRAAAIEWMYERMRHGNEQERLKQVISEPAKASARRLKHLGLIKEFPQWVEKQRDVSVKVPMCQKCQRPSEPGACICTNPNCGYIIDPKRAYEIDAIPESDLSLERLTRAEVEEMGISAYVAETRDEKAERLQAKNPGPKPLSRAAQQMLATNDQITAEQQELQAKFLASSVGKAVKDAVKGEKT